MYAKTEHRKRVLMYTIANTMSSRELDDDRVLTFVEEVFGGRPALKKSLKVDNDARSLGAHFIRTLTLEEKFLIEEKFEEEMEEKTSIFDKALVKGEVLHSANYPRVVRRNYFTIGQIDCLIVTIVDLSWENCQMIRGRLLPLRGNSIK